MEPAAHDLAQALLYPCPGCLVTLHNRTVQQLEAIRFIGGLSTTMDLDFTLALLYELWDPKRPEGRFSRQGNRRRTPVKDVLWSSYWFSVVHTEYVS